MSNPFFIYIFTCIDLLRVIGIYTLEYFNAVHFVLIEDRLDTGSSCRLVLQKNISGEKSTKSCNLNIEYSGNSWILFEEELVILNNFLF